MFRAACRQHVERVLTHTTKTSLRLKGHTRSGPIQGFAIHQSSGAPSGRLVHYSPWSNKFPGSLRKKILLQSAFYAVCIVGVTELVDSYIFVCATLPLKPTAIVMKHDLDLYLLSKQNAEDVTEHTETQYGSHKEVESAIRELQEVLPGENSVSTDPNTVKTHGFSENSYHPSSPHSVVV